MQHSNEEMAETLAKKLAGARPVLPSEVLQKMLDTADNSVSSEELASVKALQEQLLKLEARIATRHPGPICQIQAIKLLREVLGSALEHKSQVIRLSHELSIFEPDDQELQVALDEVEKLVQATIGLSSFVPQFDRSDSPLALNLRERTKQQGAMVRKCWEEAQAEGDEGKAAICMLSNMLARAASSGSNDLPAELQTMLQKVMKIAKGEAAAPEASSSPKPADDAGATAWDEAAKPS